MSLRPRRIAFQITPLVDTLLIVLFLQYLDSRQQQAGTQAEAAAAEGLGERAAGGGGTCVAVDHAVERRLVVEQAVEVGGRVRRLAKDPYRA